MVRNNEGELATIDRHHSPAVYNRDFNPTKNVLFSPPLSRVRDIGMGTEAD